MKKTNRRDFLNALALSVAATQVRNISAVSARQSETPAEPIIDFHQHALYLGRTQEQLLAHQAAHGVTTTVLLPGEGWMRKEVGGNANCAEAARTSPDRFVRFAGSDPAESRTADVLRGNVSRGAVGFGELKFHVAADSPEMHVVYRLAEQLRVPVLLHFEFEMYNTGLERFARVLEAYPTVNFIGHAQTWWANISADADQLLMYPEGRVKPGGLTDRLLGDYPNMYGDLSAYSGLNALTRDPDFTRDFLARHRRKLVWGSDCTCHDGKGGGSTRGYCLAERSLATLRNQLPDLGALRRIVYENAAALLRVRRPVSA
ncbi:MAG: amidohydrolase family protein [Acidobacteria bacterium]|nr:amidohydrolase family protein [Acidobacteriota bacterium]